MNQEQSMSDTKAAKSRTIQLCVRFDEHDVELLKTLCREEKQGRRDAIQSLAFRLEASLLSESDGLSDRLRKLESLQSAGRCPDCDRSVEQRRALEKGCDKRDAVIATLTAKVAELEAALQVSREEAVSAAKGWGDTEDELQALQDENAKLRGIIATASGKDAASFDWSVLGEQDRLETENAKLQSENERLTGVCKEFDTLVSRLSRSPWRFVATDPPTGKDGVYVLFASGDVAWRGRVSQPQSSATHWMPIPPLPEKTGTERQKVKGCPCETCRPQPAIGGRMIVCSTCGNKRCPKATYHGNACTNSNAPGQPGSSFENCTAPGEEKARVSPPLVFNAETVKIPGVVWQCREPNMTCVYRGPNFGTFSDSHQHRMRGSDGFPFSVTNDGRVLFGASTNGYDIIGPAADQPDKRDFGLYAKFRVERTDGQSAPGCKHHGCEHFVLDVTHDPFAADALYAYAESCAQAYPSLSRDLRKLADESAKRLNPSPPDTVGPTADSVISNSAPGVGQSDAPVGEDVLPLADRIADALMMVESPEDRSAAFHLEHPRDGEASPDMRVRFGWLSVRAKIASVLESIAPAGQDGEAGT